MTANLIELESLWNHERARLVRYMRRRVGPEQAEDLVQDLFLRAWSAICNGNGATEHAKGYLFRSAHNLAIDFYRARDREPECKELDAPLSWGSVKATLGEQLADDAIQPDELAMQSETVREVQGAMRRLTADQRFVLEQRMEDRDFHAIAVEMGKNEGAVKQLQQRAYAALARTLDISCNRRAAFQRTRRAPINQSASAPSKFSPSAQGIYDILLREGPLGVAAIVQKTGIHPATTGHVVAKHSHVFVVVGKLAWRGGGRVYGIRGVHDQQEAA